MKKTEDVPAFLPVRPLFGGRNGTGSGVFWLFLTVSENFPSFYIDIIIFYALILYKNNKTQ